MTDDCPHQLSICKCKIWGQKENIKLKMKAEIISWRILYKIKGYELYPLSDWRHNLGLTRGLSNVSICWLYCWLFTHQDEGGEQFEDFRPVTI